MQRYANAHPEYVIDSTSGSQAGTGDIGNSSDLAGLRRWPEPDKPAADALRNRTKRPFQGCEFSAPMMTASTHQA
jgi:hypothetical protein